MAGTEPEINNAINTWDDMLDPNPGNPGLKEWVFNTPIELVSNPTLGHMSSSLFRTAARGLTDKITWSNGVLMAGSAVVGVSAKYALACSIAFLGVSPVWAIPVVATTAGGAFLKLGANYFALTDDQKKSDEYKNLVVSKASWFGSNQEQDDIKINCGTWYLQSLASGALMAAAFFTGGWLLPHVDCPVPQQPVVVTPETPVPTTEPTTVAPTPVQTDDSGRYLPVKPWNPAAAALAGLANNLFMFHLTDPVTQPTYEGSTFSQYFEIDLTPLSDLYIAGLNFLTDFGIIAAEKTEAGTLAISGAYSDFQVWWDGLVAPIFGLGAAPAAIVPETPNPDVTPGVTPGVTPEITPVPLPTDDSGRIIPTPTKTWIPYIKLELLQPLVGAVTALPAQAVSFAATHPVTGLMTRALTSLKNG